MHNLISPSYFENIEFIRFPSIEKILPSFVYFSNYRIPSKYHDEIYSCVFINVAEFEKRSFLEIKENLCNREYIMLSRMAEEFNIEYMIFKYIVENFSEISDCDSNITRQFSWNIISFEYKNINICVEYDNILKIEKLSWDRIAAENMFYIEDYEINYDFESYSEYFGNGIY